MIKSRVYGKRKTTLDLAIFDGSIHVSELMKHIAGRSIQDMFSRILQEEMSDVSYTFSYVCRDHIGKNTVKKAHLDKWFDEVEDWLKTYHPKIIMPITAQAMKRFGYKKGTPVSEAGKITKYGKRFVIPCPHPDSIHNKPTDVYLVQRAFESVATCLRGGRTTKNQIEKVEPEDVPALLKETASQLCAFDLETSGLNPEGNHILCASISTGDKHYWFPVCHKESWNPRLVVQLVSWWSKGPRIIQNMQMEGWWFEYLGAKRPPEVYDTMLMCWHYDENTPNNLNHQVVSILKEKPYWLEMEKYDKEKYEECPLEILGLYNGHDARVTYSLFSFYREALSKQQWCLCKDVLTDLALILAEMHHNGVRVDRTLLEKLGKKKTVEAKRKLKKAQEIYPDINFRSPIQMGKLLFQTLKLQPLSKTDKGKKQADMRMLEHAAKKFPSLTSLVESKKATSFVTRVVKPWLEQSSNGFIYPHWNLGNVVTGRLSSSSPNFQNLDRGGPQKACMVSRFKGGSIGQWDYAQHELRIQAAIAGCSSMLKAFRQGVDLHQETCDKLRAQRIKLDRPTAKNVNFALIYDITPWGLNLTYGIPMDLGKQIKTAWFKEYPEIHDYHLWLNQQMRDHHYVESIFGWRRHIRNPNDGHERRQAYNQPIQNAAVVIMYLAMLKISTMLEDMKSLIIMQVHDSVVLDVHPKERKKIEKQVPKFMLNPGHERFSNAQLKEPIPLAVDSQVGRSY